MKLDFKVEGELGLRDQLALLNLSPVKKQRINQKLARKIRVHARARIRAQQDLSGTAFEGRKKKKRGKILKRLGSKLRVKGTVEDGVIDYASPMTGRIARLQQEGLDERVTKAEYIRKKESGKSDEQKDEGDKSSPATKRQAKRLRKAGFKRRRKTGSGFVNATNGWITSHLTQGQAGIIIRKLEGHVPVNAWILKGTARSFLGVNKADEKVLVKEILKVIDKQK